MKKKKTDMNELNQTNGATPQATSVFDMLGMNVGPYTATSFEEYQASLANMDLFDLQQHTIEVARIIPIDDRKRLIDRLEKEFLRVQARFPSPKTVEQMKPKAMDPKDQESLLKILNRGK